MDFFPFTKDVQAFLLRATASLERVDNAVGEAQLLIRDGRTLIADLRRSLGMFSQPDPEAPRSQRP